MNWNRDIGGAARKKRHSYPVKRTMNLYFKEDRTRKPATAMLYILFVLVVLAALSKVMVFDRLQEIEAAKAEATALESEAAAMQQSLADYAQVQERYVRLTPTERELSLTDRMAVLDLIDSVIRPAAELRRVTIQGQQALVSFSGVTLVETADLVAQLEQSELVARTVVNTAASETADRSAVDVDMLIDLALAGEEAEP